MIVDFIIIILIYLDQDKILFKWYKINKLMNYYNILVKTLLKILLLIMKYCKWVTFQIFW